MELMLVLAPYNEAIIALLRQGEPPMVACRCDMQDPLKRPPEDLLRMVQKAALSISDTGMSAPQAATLAGSELPVLGGAKTPMEAVYKLVWGTIMAAVRSRAENQKRSLLLAPFAGIEGGHYKASIEDAVMEKVVKNLESREYKDISWYRAEGRGMLRFTW